MKLDNVYETKRYDFFFDAVDKFLLSQSHELLFSIPQAKLKNIKSFPGIEHLGVGYRLDGIGRSS